MTVHNTSVAECPAWEKSSSYECCSHASYKQLLACVVCADITYGNNYRGLDLFILSTSVPFSECYCVGAGGTNTVCAPDAQTMTTSPVWSCPLQQG